MLAPLMGITVLTGLWAASLSGLARGFMGTAAVSTAEDSDTAGATDMAEAAFTAEADTITKAAGSLAAVTAAVGTRAGTSRTASRAIREAAASAEADSTVVAVAASMVVAVEGSTAAATVEAAGTNRSRYIDWTKRLAAKVASRFLFVAAPRSEGRRAQKSKR